MASSLKGLHHDFPNSNENQVHFPWLFVRVFILYIVVQFCGIFSFRFDHKDVGFLPVISYLFYCFTSTYLLLFNLSSFSFSSYFTYTLSQT